ncbi:MAG: AAA family ATPase [Anaerorhabdus sp.]
MPYNNEFYLASAGAGKTTMISQYAVDNPNLKILLTTYTTENTSLLSKSISGINGVLPRNVTVMSWFSFLLSECIRPYQNFVYCDARIENLHFIPYISSKYKRRSDVRRFYLSDNSHIYSDKMSDFACCCNETSNGLVIKRLEQLFDVFILDETQDISGWDFELIGLLLKSKIKVIMVGDVRQRTYSTSQSTKNKKYSDNLCLWFEELQNKGLGSVKWLNQSYRCIQPICDFADNIFPNFPKTKSLNTASTPHSGIYTLKSEDLQKYYELYQPQILVHDKRSATKALGLPVYNFGAVKGQTYNHVVIVPTKPIEKYLCNGNIAEVESGKERFYVAITRARYSVAFLTSCTPTIPCLSNWERPHIEEV